MKAQDVIPTETYLNIVSQSKNQFHLIALLCEHFDKECAAGTINELDAFGYISRQITNYRIYIAETSGTLMVGGVA